MVTLISMCFRFLFGFCLRSTASFCSTYQHKKLVFTPNRVTKAQIISQPDEFPSQWYFQKQFLLKKMSLFWTRILPNVQSIRGLVRTLKFGFVWFFSAYNWTLQSIGGQPIIGLHYQSETTHRNSWFGFSSLEKNLFPFKRKEVFTQGGCFGSVRLGGWKPDAIFHSKLGVTSWYQVVWSGDITLNYNAEVGKSTGRKIHRMHDFVVGERVNGKTKGVGKG